MIENRPGGDLLLQIDGAVATITIDRPGKRNALRLASWLALPDAVSTVDRDPAVRLILVRGAGRHFGAGNDIVELSALQGDIVAAETFGAAMAAATRALESASKPVMIAIEGQCYGAAVALALAGDLRLASADAQFAITPARLGAVYLASDLHRLVSAIGQGASKRLLYSAQVIGAEEARAIGLVDDVFPTETFTKALDRLIEAIAAGSSLTLLRTKRMLRDVALDQAPLETSQTLAPFVEATQGRDFKEGTAAFLEKRRPDFSSSSSSPSGSK